MKLAARLYNILFGALLGVSISAAVAHCKPEWTGNYYDGWREGIQFCNESQFDPMPANPVKNPLVTSLKGN